MIADTRPLFDASAAATGAPCCSGRRLAAASLTLAQTAAAAGGPRGGGSGGHRQPPVPEPAWPSAPTSHRHRGHHRGRPAVGAGRHHRPEDAGVPAGLQRPGQRRAGHVRVRQLGLGARLQLPADRLPARRHPDGPQRPVRRQPDLPLCRQREPGAGDRLVGRGRRRAAELRLARASSSAMSTSAPSKDLGGQGQPDLRQRRSAPQLPALSTPASTPGLSAYVSRSKIGGELWRGPGTIDRDHCEGKVSWTIADRRRPDLPGRRTTSISTTTRPRSPRPSTWARPATPSAARAASSPIWPRCRCCRRPRRAITYSNANYNQYYKQAINSREDHLVRPEPGYQPLGEDIKLQATYYYEDKKGYGVSPEAYATSLTNYNAERLIIPGLFAPKGPAVRPVDHRRHPQGPDRLARHRRWRINTLSGRRLVRGRRLPPHPAALQPGGRQPRRRRRC